MLRLSKKVEYGLIALRHLALLPDGRTATAKEIADEYALPYELCSKTLSRLTKTGLAASNQGAHGGYLLGRAAERITVGQVIQGIEGESALVECLQDGDCGCSIADVCTIKDPL